MTAQTTSTIAGTRHHRPVIPALAAGLTLVLGAGLVMWHDDASRVGKRASTMESSALLTPSAEGGNPAAYPTFEGRSPSRTGTPTFIFTRSEDQASTARERLADTNRIRFLNGERELDAMILVVDSPDAATALRERLMHTLEINGVYGAQVIDWQERE